MLDSKPDRQRRDLHNQNYSSTSRKIGLDHITRSFCYRIHPREIISLCSSIAHIHSYHSLGQGTRSWLPPNSYYEDCLFKDGLLYASTTIGEIHAFNLSAPAVPQEILGKMKDIYFERIYIVETSCNGLLQIWRSDAPPQGDQEDESDSDLEIESDPESHVSHTTAIKVHKVDPSSKKLVEISTLSVNVLFLRHNQSLCLPAEEYPQLNANHVYFIDDDYEYITGFKNNHRDIGVFDMENKSREEIVSPQLWSNWPAPVWLIPNPRRMIQPN